jgi:hypothetical protein
MSQKLHIIDALGPFIEKSDQEIINWSKVIFSDLEKNGHLSASVQNRIAKRFDTYLTRVTRLGYDSISVDDLAHLVNFSFYNPDLRALLKDYQALYRRLFDVAKNHNVKIFVNTDYLFYNDDIQKHLTEKNIENTDFFIELLEKVFETFPEIAGIILRIGEHDGTDVKGSFLSRLTLRSPEHANTLLRKILPIFEKHNKALIFRTWTIGAYKIGDLIWNEKTFDAVFSSISSDALIISMKFGDTDFMRFLSLNPLFFRSPHKKIIELQTRREWEGMGMYPSFVGWDYHNYLTELAKNKSIAGIHVWCQTGGWAKRAWTNVTYLEDSSFWNELNTEVTIDMYQHDHSPEEAIKMFCRKHKIHDAENFIKLLRLSEIAIKKGLYIRELAEKSIYFRRSRIPSLMWLTWDKALLQPSAIYLLRMLMHHKTISIHEADEAAKAAKEMLEIGKKLNLNKQVLHSLDFEHATLVLFAQLRRYIFDSPSLEEVQRLNNIVYSYTATYPEHYSIPILNPAKRRRQLPKRSLNLLFRESITYRKRDKIMFATSLIQRKLIIFYLSKSKSHLTEQSMGFDVFFK